MTAHTHRALSLCIGLSLVCLARSVGACPSSTFDEVRRLLEPNGRVVVQTVSTNAHVEIYRGARLLWSGDIKHVDCGLTAEMIRIQVERRLEPGSALPVGTVPSLTVVKASTNTAVAPERTPWALELGVGAQWETVSNRFGGSLELAGRYTGWGARLRLGGFAPRTETLGNFGDARFFSLHGILLAEGCGRLPEERFRLCGAFGGGVERIEARSSGPSVFQQSTERRWAPRIDLDASFAWLASPFGAEFVLRGHLRPSPTTIQIMGITEEAGLSRWAIVLGLRGFISFL